MDTTPTASRKEAFEKLATVVADPSGAMAWIDNFANTHPYSFNEVAGVYISLAMVAEVSVAETLQQFADAARTLGAPLTAIAMPIIHSLARGRLSMEDYQQLSSWGLPVRLLENASGRGVQDLGDLLIQGALSQDVVRDLIKEMEREFSR